MEKLTVIELFSSIESIISEVELEIKYLKSNKKVNIKPTKLRVDYFNTDSEIFKYSFEDLKDHLTYLLKKVNDITNDDAALLRLAFNRMDDQFPSPIEEEKNTVLLFFKTLGDKLNYYYSIIQSRTISQKSTTEFKNKLPANFAQDLLNFEIDDEMIFQFNSKEEKNKIITNLEQLILGNYDMITPALSFYTKFDEYAYYILHQISDLNGKDKKDFKNILINDKEYNEEARQRHISKINRKIKKSSLDNSLERFIETFQSVLKTAMDK